MTKEKKTTLTVEENGSKVNEPAATPQNAAQVQVDKE